MISRVLRFLLIILAAGFLLTSCGGSSNTQPALSISGKVVAGEQPVPGATVRIKTTEISTVTDSNGNFSLIGLPTDSSFDVTAWAAGYYIVGEEEVAAGTQDLVLILHAYQGTDNPNYAWLPSTIAIGQGENQGCAECHSSKGTDVAFPLPVDDWMLDAHSQSASNSRFLSMYTGQDLNGNQSPPTRFGYSRDYGVFPLAPDPALPYYGPGYALDFPGTAGNCATCHIPLAAMDDPYAAYPIHLTGIVSEGITCDFCHKVRDVHLDTTTGLTYANVTGIMSFEFLRPQEGHQFFAGPYDDVAPGEDTYLPLQQESQFCAPCHYGVFWDTVVYNSFGEWLASPYNDPETGKTCQNCHMPVTGATQFARTDQGGETRDASTIFSHLMPGASNVDLLQNAVSLDITAHRDGEHLVVDVNIINDKTGHDVPTDSPLRQMILLVTANDLNGTVLQQVDGPTVPEWGGVGDPADGYYAGLAGKGYAKILQEIWTEITPSGAYWNPTRVVSDNRLSAFEQDQSLYSFSAPAGVSATVQVTLWYRRAFKVLMDQKDWKLPDILMEEESLLVP